MKMIIRLSGWLSKRYILRFKSLFYIWSLLNKPKQIFICHLLFLLRLIINFLIASSPIIIDCCLLLPTERCLIAGTFPNEAIIYASQCSLTLIPFKKSVIKNKKITQFKSKIHHFWLKSNDPNWLPINYHYHRNAIIKSVTKAANGFRNWEQFRNRCMLVLENVIDFRPS